MPTTASTASLDDARVLREIEELRAANARAFEEVRRAYDLLRIVKEQFGIDPHPPAELRLVGGGDDA